MKESLSDRMKREAIELGLCEEWQGEWQGELTKDEMAERYVRGIDFCIEHGFPDNETIKREFGEVARKHGVHVDEDVSLTDEPTVILNGGCSGVLRYTGYNIGTIYVRHQSDVRIIVEDLAQVFVELYDGAHVDVENKGARRCFVYKHGGTCNGKGDVRVRVKEIKN